MTDMTDGTADPDTVRLGDERYVSLTTFRRDGTPVATPVWVARDGGVLVVVTEGGTGKAKRIRNRADVTVAPCTRRGRVTGPAVPGSARVVDGDAAERVARRIADEYGAPARLFELAQLVARRLGRGHGERVGLLVTLRPPAAPPAG